MHTAVAFLSATARVRSAATACARSARRHYFIGEPTRYSSRSTEPSPFVSSRLKIKLNRPRGSQLGTLRSRYARHRALPVHLADARCLAKNASVTLAASPMTTPSIAELV